MFKVNLLKLSWSTSRGQNTYGYNICRLDDLATGRRYKTMGGGYDMIGTVVGDWLEENFQDRLLALKNNSDLNGPFYYNPETNRVSIDGGHGIDAVIKLAERIGVSLSRNYNRRTDRTDGFFYSIN